jgi:hypothetical protein
VPRDKFPQETAVKSHPSKNGDWSTQVVDYFVSWIFTPGRFRKEVRSEWHAIIPQQVTGPYMQSKIERRSAVEKMFGAIVRWVDKPGIGFIDNHPAMNAPFGIWLFIDSAVQI